MEQAFTEHGTPSTMNSDRGSAFGSKEYVSLLASMHVEQSMDDRARWRDNVQMERWFETLKSECLRQEEYSTPAKLKGDRREVHHLVQREVHLPVARL